MGLHLHSPSTPSTLLFAAHYVSKPIRDTDEDSLLHILSSVTHICGFVFQFQPSKDRNIAVHLLWATFPVTTTEIFHGIDHFVNGRRKKCTEACLPQSYTTPVSIMLVLLGHFATWTRRYLAVATVDMDHGTNSQAWIIHFAMSFFILSECEFYRLYWVTHRRGGKFNLSSLSEIIHGANNDDDFKESRECMSYHFNTACFEIPPGHHLFSRTVLGPLLVGLACTASFHFVGMACLNYFVKRLANPNPDGDIFPLPTQFLEVFFTPRYQILLWLDVQLQRPIRILNGLLFWTIAGYAKIAWGRWVNSEMQRKLVQSRLVCSIRNMFSQS